MRIFSSIVRIVIVITAFEIYSSAIVKPFRGIDGHQEDKDTKNGSLLLHAALFMRVRGRRA